MSQADVCQQCGACCATYRIEFYRGELNDQPGGFVPAELAVVVSPVMASMCGDPDQPGRCVALDGLIGDEVACRIYAQRPGPCREFGAFAALGFGDEACNDARRRHGLVPLPVY